MLGARGAEVAARTRPPDTPALAGVALAALALPEHRPRRGPLEVP